MGTQYDVVIVGGGLAGASLACALGDSQLRIGLLDSRPDDAGNGAADGRVYAISPGSQAFLEQLGVWNKLDVNRIEPVRDMQISGDDGASRLDFSAYECAVDRLATIVLAGDLQRVLAEILSKAGNVDCLRPAIAQNISRVAGKWSLGLQNGAVLSAKLLVGADGMHSAVRAAAGIEAKIEPAGQTGIVANFSCSQAHRGVAYQWFRDDGVLAWLPLPGQCFSMVWSANDARAAQLSAADDGALCELVREAGHGVLGDLQRVSGPAAFPLGWLSVAKRVREGLVLIGDAAHVVHPLAGQEVNLGLGDACALAVQLRAAAGRGADPGELLHLRKFERSRAEAILAMQLATRGLKGLFEQRSAAATKFRNWGLNLTDRAVVLKNSLARHAMG